MNRSSRPLPPTNTEDPTAFDIGVGIASLPLILNPEGTHIALVRTDRYISLHIHKLRVIKHFQEHLNPEGRTELSISFWPCTNAKGILFTGSCLVTLA